MVIIRMTLAVWALTTSLLLTGCATLPPLAADRNLLADVVIPGTARETILLKLGEPSASFEEGRIITYRIGEDGEQGYFLMDRLVRWTNIKYSLVLVFDTAGDLKTHSLVPVR